MKINLKISLLSIMLFISCGQATGDGSATDGISANEHRIFITSTTTNGNIGGLSSADSICQARATAAGLVREYKALLGSSTQNMKSRFDLGGAVYNFDSAKQRTKIVDLGINLFDSDTTALQNNVEFDENGNTVSGTAWTGSDSEGEISTSSSCTNWTSNSAGVNGSVGDNTRTNGFWLEDPPQQACNQSYRLYCISI